MEVTIRLKNGITHTDIGYDTKIGKVIHDTRESAEKSAITDGIKRAARHLGNLFECAYNDMYRKYIAKKLNAEEINIFFNKDRLFFTPEVLPVKYQSNTTESLTATSSSESRNIRNVIRV